MTPEVYDGPLKAITADGSIIFEGVPADHYRDVIIEEVRSWSYMKFPHIRSLGREAGWYRVGPLAQMNCCASIGTPIAEAARADFMTLSAGGLVHATLAFQLQTPRQKIDRWPSDQHAALEPKRSRDCLLSR